MSDEGSARQINLGATRKRNFPIPCQRRWLFGMSRALASAGLTLVLTPTATLAQAPSITSQPQSVVSASGANASFSVVASGASPLN